MSKNVPIKDFCKIDWGNTNLTKKSYVLNGDFLAVSAKGMDGRINFFEHENDVIVLSAIGAQCGKMFFPKQKFTAIKNTITIKPDINKALPDYLFYLFNYIELPKRGSAQPFISKGDIEKFTISFLPKLNEQQRIVEKLDTCMEQIYKAIQNVEQNIQNAEELFQSYLNEIFSQKGDNWETKKLIDVFDINPKKNTNLAEKSLATYAPMKDLGFYYSKTLFTQEKSSDKMQKGLKNFIENDLLLAKVTPCFENGKLGIARNLTNGVGFGSTEYIVFRKKNKISTDYLFLFLSQDSFRLQGKRNMTGTSGLKRVPINFVKNYSISYPINNEEQNRIINLANEFKAGINTLNSNNLVKLNALKDLKKSILEKAFNGEL